ncbi:hypothetical protein KWF57_18460 [Acinetobacter baumannii]|uniref:hypothetical protein n=1 Tax=Acinetobacter baumannii TaxID=470 RepID=UPI00344F84F1
MDNYKILNTKTNAIIKLLNELGYAWVPTTNDSEASLLKAHWIIAESSGDIAYSSTNSFYQQDSYKELSFNQLNDLVVLKRNDVKDATHVDQHGTKHVDLSGQWYWFHEQQTPDIPFGWVESAGSRDYDNNVLKPITQPQDPALISGAEALRALADGKDVEYNWLNQKSSQWMLISDELKQFSLYEILNGTTEFGAIKFRLKPQTIKLELELPKPFEPKDGEVYYYLKPSNAWGFGCGEWGDDSMQNEYIQYGAWPTKEDVLKVVEQLRKIRGAS